MANDFLGLVGARDVLLCCACRTAAVADLGGNPLRTVYIDVGENDFRASRCQCFPDRLAQARSAAVTIATLPSIAVMSPFVTVRF